MSPFVPELSEREERLLLMLGDGHGIREIATALGISELRAVKIRKSACRRLGAPTTTAAVVIVVRARDRAAVQ